MTDPKNDGVGKRWYIIYPLPFFFLLLVLLLKIETELRYAANCSPKVLCVAVVSLLQSLKNSRQGSLARPIDYYTNKNETEKMNRKKEYKWEK